MRAWRVHEVGEPDRVIRMDEVAPPDAGALRGLRMSLGGWVPAGSPGAASDPHEDWVVIDVAMAALSLPDVTMARGTYPVPVPRPYTSGQEGVGVVTDAPTRHRHLVGRRVAACMIQPFGSLADVAVGVGMIVAVSDAMSDADAAAFLIPAHTGYHAVVRRGGVARGETVAITGAAGALGSACIQLAKTCGATVLAVVGASGDVDKSTHCRALGADMVIDHTRVDVADALLRETRGRGVEVIVDPVQGDGAADLRRALRAGGRHVLCGHAGGLTPIDPHFYLRNHTLVGVTLGGYPPDEMRRMHEETQTALDRMLADRSYRPTPTRVVAFEEVPGALADVAARRSAGRIVVKVGARSSGTNPRSTLMTGR